MENKLKKYLLGTLAEAEMTKIDLQLISSPDFEKELLLAENNLMEDYLDGSLSAGEIKNFREKFLVSEERRKELQNVALLKKYAQRQAVEEISGAPAENSTVSVFDKLKNLIAVYLRPLAVGAAAVIVAVFIGFYFFGSKNSELARLNQKDLSDLSEYQHLTNLSLISGIYRDAGNPNKLSTALPSGQLTDQVLLRLALPVKGEIFDVDISRNEERFVALEQIPSYSNPKGQELRLILPAADLSEGNYKVEVSSENSDAPIVYTFTIR